MGRNLATYARASATAMPLLVSRYAMTHVGEREMPFWQWIRAMGGGCDRCDAADVLAANCIQNFEQVAKNVVDCKR